MNSSTPNAWRGMRTDAFLSGPASLVVFCPAHQTPQRALLAALAIQEAIQPYSE